MDSYEKTKEDVAAVLWEKSDTHPDEGTGKPNGHADTVSPLVLSPSRANDFLQCPLLYRYRTIDKIPEPISLAQAVGSTVHFALENIYQLPRVSRSCHKTMDLSQEYWNSAIAADNESIYAFDKHNFAEIQPKISTLLDAYFSIENPKNFDPYATEQYIEASSGQAFFRGYLDRIDKAGDGRIRIVDYKTGKHPKTGFETKVVYQLKFYAALYVLSHNVLPTMLRLIFLADGKILEFSPEKEDIYRFINILESLWETISDTRSTGEFFPKKTPLCRWCSFQDICPVFGGTIPPYPLDSVSQLQEEGT